MTRLGAYRHAPAAVASPSGDIDVVPVREITHFLVNLNRCIPMRPVPLRGTGGARGGLNSKKEVFYRADFF